MTTCIFCKILAGEMPAQEVYEDETVFAFNDINPQSPVHILIIPKRHIAAVSQTTQDDRNVMGDLFMAARQIAEQKNISDYRLIVNNGRAVGQTVFHIHLHLMAGRPFSWPPG